MDVAHSRSLGFAGKEILFRKVEFEQYRKPHVVEYPRSAIVLNPQHTRQLKDSLHHHHNRDADNGGDDVDGVGSQHAALSSTGDSDDDDDDDPRRIDKTTQLCSDAQLRSSLHLRWQHITPVGLGLVNLGNTCFANSVLQALAHTPALAQYLMTTFRSADNQLGAPFDFCFALAETLRRMHHAAQPGRGAGNSIAGAYRPGQIMGNLRLLSKHFSIGRQSDAHEFAVQLLFSCQKSLLHRLNGSKKVQPRVAHTTALYRICGGYLLSQVTWSRQEEIQQLLRAGKQQEAMDLKLEARQARQQEHSTHRASRHGLDTQTLYSNTYDPFTILSVELAGHTLMHCLDKFCMAEELDGRCYHSPREVGVRARKKFSIHVPPPVLMIHLKRFGPTGSKINKHVQFPLELDITRYCTPLPSSSSTLSSPPSPQEVREDCQYELNAICVHEGSSINYGHYYAMARASNGMWYKFDDSHVSRLSEEQLQRAQAYLLCYSRVPSTGKTKPAAPARSPAPVKVRLPGAMQPVNGRASAFMTDALPAEPAEGDAGVGRELSGAELQALLEERRRDAQSTTTQTPPPPPPTAAAAAAPKQNQTARDASESESEGEGGGAEPPMPVGCAQNQKRLREELPTDSDSDDNEEANEQRDGAYMRRLRPPPEQRHSGQDNQHHKKSHMDEGEEQQERDGPEQEEEEAEQDASSLAGPRSVKSFMYGGLIKSMKRMPHGSDTAADSPDAHSNGHSSRTTAPPNFRVGRHAVSALHARKVRSTPDTVKRPATAPKFQQRIRDPMWEMEMDRGKVKKVKSKEKAPDPFEGTNPFQEVSRGMFDIRGRRRRD
ncbi:putative ubiquitin hydrolase [Leptomonas pyrrhocoris]|uniref:Ubiquitin carboxyl-terminal hydrolase n=1 Tax=Leptomonas pyrrhocoris TaxID=157538 RepID=A0A0M9FZ51_LEPPY|nr:putative ubiquitin hydrolase [Leptomonas pyrrhocoris]XP_015657514.1 putative ubiquitin hydrolase [Leptomonas pyrrhocoris]KPA79074.1 putative ubiquitin hydrolase [Leptomonas pyrrhocoris]KPA79075.1 putative ubiquitin hydrolase [Leptomonas pyrrhocoris]|eukprot:XP_015657513.1 putative ubiquitin hydrolase [Leptomonas pyrrhocoris]